MPGDPLRTLSEEKRFRRTCLQRSRPSATSVHYQVRRSLPPGLDPPLRRECQVQPSSEQHEDAKHISSQTYGHATSVDRIDGVADGQVQFQVDTSSPIPSLVGGEGHRVGHDPLCGVQGDRPCDDNGDAGSRGYDQA